MAHKRHLEKEKYRQWVKAGLGLGYLKEGLAPFCDDVAKQQHKDILDNIKQTKNLSTVTCGQCALRTLKPDHVKIGKNQCPLGQVNCNCCYTSGKIACPNNVCGAIYDNIITNHASTPPAPYWKNTQTQQWTGDPWSIAKCFINAPGCDQKTSAADTDNMGLLLMIINNKYFHNHIQCNVAGGDVFSKVRQCRNAILHSSTLELEEAKANSYIDDMIAVLQDGKELINRKDAQDAVKKLEELKKDDFIITTNNEADVVRAAVQSISGMIKEYENKVRKQLENIPATEDVETLESIVTMLETDMAEELKELKTAWLSQQDRYNYLRSKLANMIPAEILRMDKESIDLYKDLLNESKEAVHNIRVMVVGPFGVGKTTLTKRLFREDVNLNLQESTNGIDVQVRRCKVPLSNGRWNILEKGKASDDTATRLAKLLNKHVDEQKTTEKKMRIRALSNSSVDTKVLYGRKNIHEEQEETLVEDSVAILSSIVEKRSVSETSLTVGSKDQAILNELEDLLKEVESQILDFTDTNSADLSLWDFAGQYVFYSTHRLFLSRRAIYLLVTDISKDVNEIVKDESCVVDCNGIKQWTVSGELLGKANCEIK
ncbi:uncharacterized protein LOC128554496 [Mercenaria mercenaria]|uniref:uncharacterized protein LOC128554496 n=1 Tax=Mercenaria mercenaria TaxID=6596 RepID=UPI00234F9F78|nr:uncharacterized protein LOC128554496 [Mercenaria mercenaria]